MGNYSRLTPQRRWEPKTEALQTGTAWSHATIEHTTQVHMDVWVENTTRPYHRRPLHTFFAALREQWATNSRPTPQRRWEPETEALRTGTAWSHVFETKKHWPDALPGARFKCTKLFEADDFRSHPPTPRGPQPHSRCGGTTPASPAGEHTTAPARALTSVPRYYFAFFARPRRHTSKKAYTTGGPSLQTVGMAPNSTNACPGHALKKTLRPNLSPRLRGIETSASNMVKHGQTWSNMVIHAPRTAGGPALQTVGMAPNPTYACHGSISRFERPPGADLLEFDVVVDLLDSDDDTPIGFKESLRLRDLSSPAPFHKTGAKKGGDNPQAGCSTDPQPGEAPS